MIQAPSELQPAFEKLAAHRPDAVIVQPSLSVKDAARLALALRLPAVSPAPEFAEVGGLFANHADEADIERTVASYTSRILKGCQNRRPAPSGGIALQAGINLKTARALGIILPPLVLAQADHVIDEDPPSTQ